MAKDKFEIHDDDKPVGRVLSRREVLGLLGGAGAAFFVGTGFKNLRINQTATATPSTSVPGCVVRPAKTEGPYFVEEMLNRSDIRIEPSDGSIKEGIPLQIVFQVQQLDGTTCQVLEGAQVDVWHCDALGVYSDTTDPGFDTTGQKWLRGYQVTDELGTAQFTTIYPGWYQGRAVHIHFKIRTNPEVDDGYEFTSQLFFDENMTDIIHAQEPYAEKGYRTLLNEDDGIFADDGAMLTLDVVENEDDTELGGYKATFYITLDLNADPVTTGMGGGGQGGNGGGAPPGGGNGGPGGRPPGGGNGAPPAPPSGG